MRRKLRYPGEEYGKKLRPTPEANDDEPDILDVNGFCPNYNKYPDRSPEELLVWFNLD